VRLTKSDKLNFERFGCTFRDDSVCIDWKGRRSSQAASAQIYSCLSCVKTASGPLVLLACEIAAIRPLPNYCYFPFDLKKEVHRNYLSRLTANGEIKVRFLSDKVICARNHRFTPYLRLRASEVLSGAIQQLESMEGHTYDFEKALRLVERHIRIPDFLNRLLLEDTVSEISQKIAVAVEAVPTENRELANGVVKQLAEAFKPYYQRNRNSVLELLHNAPRGLTALSDLHRIYADDTTGLIQFLRDGLAASCSRKELESLKELITVVLFFISAFRDDESTSKSESVNTIPELPLGMIDLVHSMKASGISKDAAGRFLQLIGLEVGGKPGRPTKDYSREYEFKLSGHSWTEVARQAMSERQELRLEFGGRDFDSLDQSDQERVWNRIRQGVIGYAERTGKSLPSEVLNQLPLQGKENL
jgi:hypothetical protein